MNKNPYLTLVHEIAIWLLAVMFVLSGSISAQHRFSHIEHVQNGLTQICVNSYVSSADAEFQIKDTNKNSENYQNNCDACITSHDFSSAKSNSLTHIQNVNLFNYNSSNTIWRVAQKNLYVPPARGPPSFTL
jgi:hypothetical protein